MAYSFVDYVGDGATVLFSVPFPYINQSDVAVKVNGVLKTLTTDYTWQSSTQIHFVVAPPNTQIVDIRRSTQKATANVTFQDASGITAADLNSAILQELYISQETLDAAGSGLSLDTGTNKWNANSVPMENLGNGVLAQDAVTVAQLAAAAIAPANLPLAIINGGTGGTTQATARTALGLGSAAVLTAGVAPNNAVQLDGTSKLPAVDGSALTGIGSKCVDGTRGLKIVPYNVPQGTWTNGTTTYAANASGFYTLYSTTNGDGFSVGDTAQFGAVGVMVSQVQTGVPVFAPEYWNGAWVALTLTATPVFTALGIVQFRFTPPGDWVTGGSGTGMPAGQFNVRFRASTAPSQAVQGRAFLVNKSTVTADEVILSTAAGVKVRHTAVNLTVDIRAQAINGRDQAGAFGANSWVYLYIASDGTTASGLWSASSTAPTLQGAQTSKLVCNGFRIDANQVLLPEIVTANKAQLYASVLDLNAGSSTTVASITCTVPPEATSVTFKVENNAASASTICLHDKPFLLSGSTNFTSDCQYSGTAWAAAADPIGQAFIRLTIPQTVYYAVSSSAYNLRTNGWDFPGNLG